MTESGSAPRWIGVDIGGSAIKLGALAPDGTNREERSLEVAGRRVETLLDALAREISALERAPCAVGVGLPGLLDREAGCIRRSPNLPWLEGLPVRAELARRLGLGQERVVLENDANVAALGERWLGAARGVRDALVVTLGTGIGGGWILCGELFTGAGLAGEIGHVSIDPAGPACGCGSRGCLETLASASAARRRAEERGLPVGSPGNLELLTERARASAGPERMLLEAIGLDLGRGLAAAVTLLDVRTFVVGGGFSAALDVLEPGIRRGIEERTYGERAAAVRIVRAALGAGAGWIGAARLCASAPDPSR